MRRRWGILFLLLLLLVSLSRGWSVRRTRATPIPLWVPPVQETFVDYADLPWSLPAAEEWTEIGGFFEAPPQFVFSAQPQLVLSAVQIAPAPPRIARREFWFEADIPRRAEVHLPPDIGSVSYRPMSIDDYVRPPNFPRSDIRTARSYSAADWSRSDDRQRDPPDVGNRRPPTIAEPAMIGLVIAIFAVGHRNRRGHRSAN